MNMISTGSFLTETGASNKQSELVKKLTAAWEKKNSKTARAGGASLMALSLAACGGEDDTPFAQADIDAATAPLEAAVAAAETAQAAAEADAAAALVAQATAEADAAAALVAQAAAEADAATALVAQAAAEADAAAALVAQTAAEADAAAATVAAAEATAAKEAAEAAQATAEADAAAANVAAAEATAAKEAAETAQATAEAALATAQADLTAKTAEYDALVASNATLQGQYDTLVAPKSLAATTATDTLQGGPGDDAFTAAAGTVAAADRFTDSSTVDNDTLTITHTTAPGAFTATNIENINVNLNNVGALAVDAQNFSGVNNLTVTRGNVEVGGVTLAGDKTMVVNNVDGAEVSTITAGAGTTSVDINAEGAIAATGQAGITVNANTATTTVDVNLGPATINADNAVTRVAIDGAVYTTATELAKASVINAAKAATVTTDVGLTGSVEINAAAASTITVSNAAGGATVNGSTTSTADSTITLVNVDASGATITAGTGSSVGSAKQMNIVIDGTALATDAATINAAGVVALDADATSAEAVDILTLGSTGGAVTYNIATPAGGTDNSINTITGTSDVTVAGNAAVFSGAAISGVGTIDLNAGTTGTAVDADSWSNVGKIDVGYDVGNAVSYLNGQTYELTLDQTGLDLDLYATGSAQTVTIVAGDDNGTDTTVGTIEVGALTIDDGDDTVAGTITIEASTANFTATSMDFGAKQNLVITGDEDVNLGQTTGGANTSINAAASSGIITLTTTTLAPTVTTGSGADVITVNGADVHTVSTNDGNDQIIITDTSDTSTFDGGAGNDQFTLTQTTKYVVVGGAGNDTFTTGGVIDAVIVGGDGTDTITLDATRDVSAQTYFAMSGIEALNLTAGNFTVDSAQFAGDNTFAITADGDTFRVDVDATTGGTIDASGVTVASGSTAVLTYAGNTGVDNITGGAAAETILQSAGADSYDGGTGSDSITLVDTATDVDGALTGDDATGVIINLGSTAVDEATVLSNVSRHFGEGTTSVGAGKASFLFSAASATNAGQVNADVLQSVQSIENITGGSGNDYIVGTAGANTLDGGAGVDYISGGDGDDTINISAGTDGNDDIMVGGNGDDTLAVATGLTATINGNNDISGVENVALTGTASIVLTGQTEGFTITGGTGINTITGGAGADTITGNAGADVIDLGNADTAADVVKLLVDGDSTAAATDTVASFEVATDKIDFLGTTLASAVGGAVDVKAAEAGGGGGKTITATVANGVATIAGGDASDINTKAEALNVLGVAGVVTYTDTAGVVDEVVIAIGDGSNTYVAYYDDGDADGTLALENVVQLTGITGITAVATTAAANTVVIM